MRILCVHPNFELYGSDRSFAMAVDALSKAAPGSQIDVLLPQPGPILTIAPFDRIPPRFRDMWVLRRRGLLSRLTLGFSKNIAAIWRAWCDMRHADITYINTIIAIDFIIAARFARRPVVIHVREIPTGMEMLAFRAAIRWSSARLIFNSDATRSAFRMPEQVRSAVVYNGYDDPGKCSPPTPPIDRPLKILVIGRLNHWKGQEIVIEAVAHLPAAKRQRLSLRIVGGVFDDQDNFQVALQSLIKTHDLESSVRICPFESDPTASFKEADVVVVPSRLPEPFGRIAIEAMAHARAVVCSAHGGLTEIVVNNVTGRHFPPSNAKALSQIFLELIATPETVEQYGRAGRARYEQMFTSDISSAALLRACGICAE